MAQTGTQGFGKRTSGEPPIQELPSAVPNTVYLERILATREARAKAAAEPEPVAIREFGPPRHATSARFGNGPIRS